MLARQRVLEGPSASFRDTIPAAKYPVIEIIASAPVLSQSLNPSMSGGLGPTTFLRAMTTSAPIFIQLNKMFPEVVAVNALYTHGLLFYLPDVRGCATAALPSQSGWAS